MSGTGKNIKTKNADKNEEAVIYRAMVAILITAVIVCVLVFLYNRYQRMTWFLYIYEAVFYIAIVAAVLAVCCAVAAIVLRKRPKPRKYLLTAMGWLLALAVSCVVMRVHVWEGIVWLFIAYPSALILYILYLIYPWEFFFLALQGAVSGIGWFVLYKMGSTMLRPWTIALLALFLLVCLLLTVLADRDGQLTKAGLHLRIYNEPRARTLLLITTILGIAGLVLTAAVGGITALVCAGIMLLWLIIMACWYTVKLV